MPQAVVPARIDVVATQRTVVMVAMDGLQLLDLDGGVRAAMPVVFVRRPGVQAQFSAQLRAQPATSPPIAAVRRWLSDHLDEDLSVEALASRAAMSPTTSPAASVARPAPPRRPTSSRGGSRRRGACSRPPTSRSPRSRGGSGSAMPRPSTAPSGGAPAPRPSSTGSTAAAS